MNGKWKSNKNSRRRILCCIINKNEVKIVLKAENLTLNVDDEGGKNAF